MTQTEQWTIGRLLDWTTRYLGEHGSSTPRLDAEVLLADSRGCRRIDLYTAFDQVPNDTVRQEFRERVKRRTEGMPVAYLVGRREFYSLSFRVTPDVLIPRPETEFLVVRLLDLARGHSDGRPLKIVDVGTGSGVLAVCAAVHLPTAQVTAIDSSLAALEIARANAAEHGVDARIAFVEGDLLTAVPAEARFDFVLSNPPYVSDAEYAELPRGIRDYEPRSALAAGPRGTEVIARLIPQAAERLVAGGVLLMEISPMIESAVRQLVEADGRFALRETRKDLAGLARVIEAERS